jgi:hypothetical protein
MKRKRQRQKGRRYNIRMNRSRSEWKINGREIRRRRGRR